MVNVKKRNKRSRQRGSRTLGYGFRKKHKGHGNAGGHGWSGTGKRGGQKQQKALMHAREHGFETYFGRRGYTSAPTQIKKTEQINLDDIKANYFEKDGQKIDLKKHKILGEGEGFKAEIHALAASKSAIEKMNKAGGKIVLPEKTVPSEKKVEEKKESAGKKEVEVKKPAAKKEVKK